MEEEIIRLCPHKIDIGPVYNLRPNGVKAPGMKPVLRELIFDIDLTDYDSVRSCCKGGDVCCRCWKFMVIAIKVLDAYLRDDLNLKHMLWVFSGRRGIHLWVADAKARILTGLMRTSVVEHLSPFQSKKATLTSIEKYHPSLRRAYKICLPYFKTVCLQEQEMFAGEQGLQRLIDFIGDSSFVKEVKTLLNNAGSEADSATRWEIMTAAVKEKKKKGGNKRGGIYSLLYEEEMVLRLLLPRLDAHVTTGIGHLLKSPFCVHPKTGRISIPINPKTADKFNPNTSAPMITQLLKEVDAFDAEISSTDETLRVIDARKTSLHKSLVLFEEFLRGIENERREERLVLNDSKMEF